MEATPARITFAGIDWSWQHHAVCVVDDHGARLDEATVPHSRPGLAKITALLRRHDVGRVGIERGDEFASHVRLGGIQIVEPRFFHDEFKYGVVACQRWPWP